MFGLLKILIFIVVIMIGLGFALEYLPGSDAMEWGKKAAKYGMKGARGSVGVFSGLIEVAKAELDKKNAEGGEPAPKK